VSSGHFETGGRCARRAHHAQNIKDMLALLRLVENPRDRVAGFRVMQLMPGVGPTSAQRVLDRMMEAGDPIGALAGAPSPPRAGAAWTAFVETIADLNAGRAGWPAELSIKSEQLRFYKKNNSFGL
jgi:DNA helicase II / ATP-dependent DNA helicase PcrA